MQEMEHVGVDLIVRMVADHLHINFSVPAAITFSFRRFVRLVQSLKIKPALIHVRSDLLVESLLS